MVRRVNEADKVVVPKFPTVAQLDMWLITVSNNLVNAGGRTDRAEIAWVKAASDRSKTYDQLADSGEARFTTLDSKLKVALMPTIKADCPILHAKLNTLEREAFAKLPRTRC